MGMLISIESKNTKNKNRLIAIYVPLESMTMNSESQKSVFDKLLRFIINSQLVLQSWV